jgi:hypothetical protein
MRHSNPALRALSESLATVVATKDEKRLREILEGRSLPALGGGLPPSEIIRQALYHAADVRPLAMGLATLLAGIVRTEAQALRRQRAVLDPGRRALVLETLRLAAELPAQIELFRALRDLLAAFGRKEESIDSLRLPLWEALSYQQTDASLEMDWQALIEGSPEDEWTPVRRTLLLIAWRGLLWIPPSLDPNSARRIVRLDRIETGLLLLAHSVRGHEEAEDLMREALETLVDTFPRSAEFWEENLRPRIGIWPEGLREKALEIWPGLQPHGKVRALRRRAG